MSPLRVALSLATLSGPCRHKLNGNGSREILNNHEAAQMRLVQGYSLPISPQLLGNMILSFNGYKGFQESSVIQ
jgi:hypothetical protein